MLEKHSANTPSKSIQKTHSTDDFKQKFRVHFAALQTLRRRGVGEAWGVGQALHEIKARLPHGEFRAFLEAEGIARETAARFMRLSKGVSMTQIGTFDSMDAALKSIPSKVSSRPAVDTFEPSKAEIKEIEQEQDRHRAELSEAELDSAHKEIKRLQALSPQAGPAPPPDDSLEREVKKSSETWSLLETSRRETKRLKRKLSAIKSDLADDKPSADILAKHYGVAFQTGIGIEDRG